MNQHEIKIDWTGPFTLDEVIENLTDGGGKDNNWDGEDYGIYQIYGKHILCLKNTLLYVGIALGQTFAQRFNQHKPWLIKEEDINIYVGRIYDSEKHTEKNNWATWQKDIELAEKIMIYKYAPNYNSRELTSEPDFSPYDKVRLIHLGKRNRLESHDKALEDYGE